MLNDNLLRIRKERGLTQEALAIKLNVVRQTVSKWEKGIAVPDADTLCRIADALDVSAAELLGEAPAEELPDTAAIAKSLAQINEQLAVRNRNSATFWKVLCMISLMAVCVLVGKALQRTAQGPSKSALPDIVEVSGVNFSAGEGKLFCTFVPGIGSESISYTVVLKSPDNSLPSVTAAAKYDNGICTASFEQDKLWRYGAYCAVLSMEYLGEVRNLTLANELNFDPNGCSWRP